MNIFVHDLKRNRWSFLIWTVSLTAFSLWLISLYSSMGGVGPEFQEYVNQFPESFRKAFGIDRLSLDNIMGWFGTSVRRSTSC